MSEEKKKNAQARDLTVKYINGIRKNRENKKALLESYAEMKDLGYTDDDLAFLTEKINFCDEEERKYVNHIPDILSGFIRKDVRDRVQTYSLSADDINDIVQECWLRIYKEIDRYDPDRAAITTFTAPYIREACNLWLDENVRHATTYQRQVHEKVAAVVKRYAAIGVEVDANSISTETGLTLAVVQRCLTDQYGYMDSLDDEDRFIPLASNQSTEGQAIYGETFYEIVAYLIDLFGEDQARFFLTCTLNNPSIARGEEIIAEDNRGTNKSVTMTYEDLAALYGISESEAKKRMRAMRNQLGNDEAFCQIAPELIRRPRHFKNASEKQSLMGQVFVQSGESSEESIISDEVVEALEGIPAGAFDGIF